MDISKFFPLNRKPPRPGVYSPETLQYVQEINKLLENVDSVGDFQVGIELSIHILNYKVQN